MQGESDRQRELLDVGSVAGHLLEPGSVFGLLAEHRDRLFPAELFADLFPSGRGWPSIPGEVIASGRYDGTTLLPNSEADEDAARIAIGQEKLVATPLQMALVAAAVANDGQVMAPHVLDEVRDSDGNVVDTYDPEEWTRAMDPGTAALLREAMVGVVEGGTATRLAVPGFTVGGKTGTAQLGTDPPRSHAWIIGFGGPPGEVPSIAVAVIIEGQDGASEQTGGRVAAPIAQALLQAHLTNP